MKVGQFHGVRKLVKCRIAEWELESILGVSFGLEQLLFIKFLQQYEGASFYDDRKNNIFFHFYEKRSGKLGRKDKNGIELKEIMST